MQRKKREMPNWCENNLSIYGEIEEMKKIMAVIKIDDDTYSLLEKLYPTPDELKADNVKFFNETDNSEDEKDRIKKFGYKNWYDWRIAKWGTKWTESDLQIGQEYTEHIDHAVIAFNFNSAWSPPIEAFNKISEDYPNLVFCLYYEEPGMGFCGSNIWANGEEKESYQTELVSRYFDEEYLYEQYITNK